MPHRHATTVYFLLILGLGGYLLPWTVAPTAPLTLNAYDLAEWTRQHPTQSQSGILMTVPLLLRVQLPIIAMLTALFARSPRIKPLAALMIVLLALAQLPPLEFVTIARHDSNYQQQFLLAAISLVAGLGLLSRKPSRPLVLAALGLAIIGLMTSLAGQHQARLLYEMSLQESAPGVGAGVLALAYIGMIAAVFTDSNWRGRPMDVQ